MFKKIDNDARLEPDEIYLFHVPDKLLQRISFGRDHVHVRKPLLGLARHIYETYQVDVRKNFEAKEEYSVSDVKASGSFKIKIRAIGKIDRDPERARLALRFALPENLNIHEAALASGRRVAGLSIGERNTADLGAIQASMQNMRQAFRQELEKNGITVEMANIELIPHSLPAIPEDGSVAEISVQTAGDLPLNVHANDTSTLVRYGLNLLCNPDTAQFSRYLTAQFDTMEPGGQSLRGRIESEVLSFLNGRYTFEQHVSELPRIRAELETELKSRLPRQWGLAVKHLILRSSVAESIRHEDTFAFPGEYPVNGTRTLFRLQHSITIRRTDAGKWLNAGSPNIKERVTQWTIRATERWLQPRSFADILLLDQRARSSALPVTQEIVQFIEDAVKPQARAVGFEVEQFLAQIIALPETQLLSGVALSIEQTDYGLRDQNYRPSIGFVLNLKLQDPARLREISGVSDLLEERVKPRARSIIGLRLASVSPVEFVRSTLASSGGNDQLRRDLETDLKDALGREFGLSVTLSVTHDANSADVVSTRVHEIIGTTRDLKEIRGVATSNETQTECAIALRVAFRVAGIWPDRTDIFLSKVRLTPERQLKEVEELIERSFEAVFNSLPYEAFERGLWNSQAGVELRERLRVKIGAELGIDIEITDLQPRPLEIEQSGVRIEIRKKLEELRARRLELIIRADSDSELSDLKKRLVVIDQQIELLEEEQKKDLASRRRYLPLLKGTDGGSVTQS